MTTARQAVVDLSTIYRDTWIATGNPIARALFPNVTGGPPTGAQPWARLKIDFLQGEQPTLVDGSGGRRFRQHGLLWVQLFVAEGNGIPALVDLCDTFKNAYFAKNTTNGVLLRKVGIGRITPDGNYLMGMVTARFEYDEIR